MNNISITPEDLQQGRRYIFHCDANHGWLQVPLSDLVALGIDKDISPYSYLKGTDAFLEEDSDLSIFCRAYEKHFSIEKRSVVICKEVDDGNYSAIRSYKHYELF